MAWGYRNNTGLCIVRDGQVLESHVARTDDEILSWLRPRMGNQCILAIDAPLVVRNLTGRRRCESLISHVFHRSQAGAHSSNLGLSAFEKGVRAMDLALALGLSCDPIFPPDFETSRCLEVYPHPALVALFDLPLTLKYKAKPGRTPLSRRSAFMELFRHLESLLDGDPPLDVTTAPRWGHLTQEVQGATSNAVLDRCEDEIDAYVCAYVALYYWTHGIQRCRVVGDLATGYIVTPVSESLGLELDRAMEQPLKATGHDRYRPSQTPVGKEARSPILRTAFCGCGCGSPVQARYRRGHDARHRSQLLRAARAGDDKASAELVRLGWDRSTILPR